MAAVAGEHSGLARWLVTLPGLDTSLATNTSHLTVIHFCSLMSNTPLDIVICLCHRSRNHSLQNIR